MSLPHIKRCLSPKYQVHLWWCKGQGVVGVGFTPKEAYVQWKMVIGSVL